MVQVPLKPNVKSTPLLDTGEIYDDQPGIDDGNGNLHILPTPSLSQYDGDEENNELDPWPAEFEDEEILDEVEDDEDEDEDGDGEDDENDEELDDDAPTP